MFKTVPASIPFRADEDIYFRRVAGTLQSLSAPVRMIDLFSGAGGLSAGFSAFFGHFFEPVWANDHDPAAAKTYNRNFGPHCVQGDLSEILDSPEAKIPRAQVVIGGPPCQGFSLLNKKRRADPRKQLWRPFMEIVARAEADIFLMENVPQLIGSAEHGEILEAAAALGFQSRSAILCAADYGVPQTRWRAFVLGCRFADPASVFPPRKTHVPNARAARKVFPQEFDERVAGARPWRTVRDAIADLPRPAGTAMGVGPPPLDLHFHRNPTEISRRRYRAIPEQGMNRFDLQRRAPDLTPPCWIRKKSGGTDLFGRLWWDRPAFTIRTEFFKPEKGRYLHPVQHRPLTHREAARIQTFPDLFRFEGGKTEIARQIGNAVPPTLAARLADCVHALLEARSGFAAAERLNSPAETQRRRGSGLDLT